MATSLITLDGSAAQRAVLTQKFMMGGFNLVGITVPPLGPYFVIPQDPQRKYLSFSVQSGQPDITAIPGQDNGTIGFNLTAANLPWEIGGNVMQCLTGLQWLLYSTANSNITIGFIRDCGK